MPCSSPKHLREEEKFCARKRCSGQGLQSKSNQAGKDGDTADQLLNGGAGKGVNGRAGCGRAGAPIDRTSASGGAVGGDQLEIGARQPGAVGGVDDNAAVAEETAEP